MKINGLPEKDVCLSMLATYFAIEILWIDRKLTEFETIH